MANEDSNVCGNGDWFMVMEHIPCLEQWIPLVLVHMILHDRCTYMFRSHSTQPLQSTGGTLEEELELCSVSRAAL